MVEEIIRRDLIEAKARQAASAGLSRDSHNMNWHAAALPTWLAEYDRMQHTINHIAAVEARVDAAQEAAA